MKSKENSQHRRVNIDPIKVQTIRKLVFTLMIFAQVFKEIRTSRLELNKSSSYSIFISVFFTVIHYYRY